MSRDVRRVPVDFEWPLNKTWSGYRWPDKFREVDCPDCENGYAPAAHHMYQQWYGNAPFDPASTGSTPLTPDSPVLRAQAERKTQTDAWFYGSGEAAIVKEAARLADLFNGMWLHHLAQEDVNALVAAGRLMDFTHTFSPETRWQKIDPPVTPTAADVNEWSLSGMGHDSINASVVLRARCERDGVDLTCPTCKGHATLEAYEGQRAESEAYKAPEPPEGEGWQLWETVSDGSPVTPVFATAEKLVTHLVEVGEQHTDGTRTRYRRAAAEALVASGSSIGSMFQLAEGGEVLDGAKDADLWPTGAGSTA